jgi:serine/threonine protein kinase
LASICLDEAAFPQKSFFIDLLDLSESGALIESSRHMDPDSRWVLVYRDPDSSEIKHFAARAVWMNQGPNQGCLVGLEFVECLRIDPNSRGHIHPSPKEMDFLAGMLLMDWVPRHAFCELLNCFQPERFGPGDKIIRQGDQADFLYILQEGICSVSVEKEGKVHRIDRIYEGEIFGEMAIITGEPRSAHVDAETEVAVWKLSKDDFERVADENHDLRGFLTELVANRFDSSTLSADRRIGKYIIKRKIGKGGWSIVYEGLHETLRFPVAIKVMRHDMALDAKFADQFKNEAQLIAGMSQRNIVQVYDIEEGFGTVFIIMEYLDGLSLEGLLRQSGRLPVARGLNFLVQASAGLDYAHKLGIVHQDIKPANIFILQNDRVKILDFGLACRTGSEDLCFLGTVYYTAPEQILGRPVGPYTDIYALGLTAYEIFTGTRPFPENDLSALLEMHVNTDIPDPAKLVPDLPEPIRKFILKSARKNMDERYQSTEDALKDLLPLARSLGCSIGDNDPPFRKATTMLLSYSEDQELEVKRALERFYLELRDLGVNLNSADFENI